MISSDTVLFKVLRSLNNVNLEHLLTAYRGAAIFVAILNSMVVHLTPFTTAAGIQDYAQLDPLPFSVAPSIGKCTCLLRGTIYAYKPFIRSN